MIVVFIWNIKGLNSLLFQASLSEVGGIVGQKITSLSFSVVVSSRLVMA